MKMKIRIAAMGDSLDSAIRTLIKSNGNKKNIVHYKNDPKTVREYLDKHKYDLIAVNCDHPRGKSIAALLHEKKENNKISCTIAEVYRTNGKQSVKTYK